MKNIALSKHVMLCTFKPCPLEKKSNVGFKQEHVESCSSNTKNIISPLKMRGSHQ